MHPIARLIATLFINALLFTAAFAQDAARYDADREKALYLVEQNNFKDALPLLEKLYASKPDDTKVLPNLALALVATAATNPNREATRKDIQRARALAEQAKKLGDDSNLVQMLLEKLPADGNLDSPAKGAASPAEEALLAGEAHFNSGQLEKAIAEYERAAQLEPKLYEAPLYVGDVYFKMGKVDEAGKAYARAIALNPDRDTAYRYWGNVLLQNGRLKEAREQLIEAVIAEPYSRAPWQFLSRWAQASKVQLSHPRVDIPNSVQKKDDKNLTILMMPSEKKDGTEAWTVYSIVRAGWMLSDQQKFKQAYPNEPAYRHSLAEEFGALRLLVETVERKLKDKELKEKDLDVSIANLLKLQHAGLLEAFILFAKADEGIARDYPEYRKANRAKLRQYLTEFVTAGQ